MLPPEVVNLKTQFLLKEISTEDFFCLVNAMFEFDEAKYIMIAILAEFKADIRQQRKATDQLLLVYDQLSKMAENLYGLSESVGNSSQITDASLDNYDDLIYVSDDENIVNETNSPKSSRHLATTDQFYDDGRVAKVDEDIAFNLTLDEVAKKETSANRKKRSKKKHLEKKEGPVILWFRRDLRIYDNPTLNLAADQNRPVLPLFIWCEHEEGPLAAGGATKVWLEQALAALSKSLDVRYHTKLILRNTNTSALSELLSVVKETGARTVVWTALYEPLLKQRDDRIQRELEKQGLDVHIEHSYLLHRPDQITVAGVGARGIGSVTHFMECCKSNPGDSIGKPVEPPKFLESPKIWPASHTLEALRLYKMPVRRDGTRVDWAKDIRESWEWGEDGGYSNLREFLDENVGHYENESSRADQKWTAVISPYLHWGELSPRTVLHEGFVGKIAAKFRRKLAWRDMSYWLLHLFPDMDRNPMRLPFKHQVWIDDRFHLKAWQKGNTGYPLVDAAMRQLWRIGWTNNYMRHVVASFLLSYLRISWVEGYKWFQDTLVDADVAINAMMWQNGGMSGLDQWNFVMHPVDAAFTCDPKGDFVRKWIPELSSLPDKYIHQPWKCPTGILARAGVILGETYPVRIVENLEECREQSLRDVTEVRRKHSRGFIDPQHGRDMAAIPCRLLGIQSPKANDIIMVPLITRKEFIYRTGRPDATDNPYNAVLKGYVSRERDEAIERLNRVDFTASTMKEFQQRKERENKQNGIVDPDEVGGGRGGRRRGAGGSRGGALQRRTKTHDQFTKV